MNIAIDIRCLMERELTGVGEYTFHLLKHLFEIDNENHYYLFYNSRQDVSQYVPKFPKDNVHYCKFNYSNKFLNLHLKFLKRPKLDLWIQKKYKTPKIDLFLFPNISFLKTDCPYVITAHDISFEFFPEFLSLKRKFWHKYINPKKLFQEATKIITVSKNTEQDLINHYLIQPQKVRTILSGISPNYKILKRNDQCPSPNDQKFKKIRKKYNLPEKFILFLGTIEPRKNINTLIDAFNQFKQNTDSDLSLVIAGKLGWKFKQESKKTRKQESIHLPGFILDSEKRYFYNLAEMFVYPSYYEGFGFPPLEAMACGCPVITANNSSLSEICQNAALLVDPTNINDLVAAIQEIQAPETKNFFIKKGLKHCKQFSWYRTARELLQLFEEIKK